LEPGEAIQGRVVLPVETGLEYLMLTIVVDEIQEEFLYKKL